MYIVLLSHDKEDVNMEYIVSANNISKKYKKFYALKDMSINIPKGSIYGLVGRNGSGKTTLIRVLCGLQHANEGEYSLFGVENSSREIVKSRRKIAAVVETPSLYLSMTAYQNLKVQSDIIGNPNYDNLNRLLELVGLNDTGKKRVKNFSLGMKQRLGIAVALVGNPELLILDEPLNGLDPQGMVDVRELILNLNENNNVSFLISSHMLGELTKVATHYGVMDNGVIIQEISAKELNMSCRKCTCVEVTSMPALIKVLDDRDLVYTVISETIANIYGDIRVSDLVLELDKLNCELINSSNEDESLESYFINLVGGSEND